MTSKQTILYNYLDTKGIASIDEIINFAMQTKKYLFSTTHSVRVVYGGMLSNGILVRTGNNIAIKSKSKKLF